MFVRLTVQIVKGAAYFAVRQRLKVESVRKVVIFSWHALYVRTSASHIAVSGQIFFIQIQFIAKMSLSSVY